MASPICEVTRTIKSVAEMLSSGRLTYPRCRHRAEELLKLLEDVSWGRGGAEHYTAMETLARTLVDEGPDEACVEAGSTVLSALHDHREVFASHIETHICPTGECVKLAPAPCQIACPAGIDVPSYVTLIGLGRDAEAVELIREDNPFPWVCGLVCTNPCEFMCVRGRMDKPISIKYLKGFAAERAMSEMRYKNPSKAPDNGRKVCIIGAGPAGMTAAYYLALKGYRVTIIEALPVPGGMMMVGIPRYRLPREVIDREAGAIEELGVEFRYNTKLGQDVTFEELRREGFEAFLIAVGAHDAYKLMVPGEEDYPQVIDAIGFLRRVALGDRHAPGKKVAVVGGGNVAIDAARTCIRLGCESVTIVYRRTRSEMPAHEEEVTQAEEEGVNLVFLTVPVAVKGDQDGITGLQCLRAELGQPDEKGRRRPVPIEGSEHLLEVDAVISAIGQTVDNVGLTDLEDLKWSKRNTIATNTVTMETSVAGVFAAGDVVSGPATVVEAIGGGKKAAEAIDRYLHGIPQPQMPPVPVRRRRLECIEMPASTKMSLTRPEMPFLNTDRRRITFQQVELGYPENAVREEARRCLRCDICRRCGRCVEICRDMMGVNALQLGYLDFDHPVPTDLRSTAERCIACGACAANCPNEAMIVRDQDGERCVMLCGTVLNRLKLEYCQQCGVPVGPARYHDYITKRIKSVGPTAGDLTLCVACARKLAAERHSEISPPASTRKPAD
ncbi:FAD-dependent oxidoreductase [Desulfoferrobacter suflitae]|uniref:FAD-dependent oxidoreductase n=1 Tax=Desulfoferrobacter suflitae TaxID=2865782 RepID=UPI002164CDA7|nr:FAD-dependent oxidoreductase [Desulfoferrobacter suflitae]MCK8600647.1 FAD-dependent oxidoreductase [Desulfoferrobacter suflitae]